MSRHPFSIKKIAVHAESDWHVSCRQCYYAISSDLSADLSRHMNILPSISSNRSLIIFQTGAHLFTIPYSLTLPGPVRPCPCSDGAYCSPPPVGWTVQRSVERSISTDARLQLQRRMSTSVADRFIAVSFIRLALPRPVRVSLRHRPNPFVPHSNCVIVQNFWRLQSTYFPLMFCYSVGVHTARKDSEISSH